MARTRPNVPGAPLLFGALGGYLVFAGIRNVPLIDGLRQLLRGRLPESRPSDDNGIPGTTWENEGSSAPASSTLAGTLGLSLFGGAQEDGTSSRLVGNAKRAYFAFRAAFPGMTIGGWRATGSVPGSDHPKGLALDLMTTHDPTARKIILMFRSQPGAKYWIWNRQAAYASNGWRVVPYTGPSPHTDHVHLSYTA
jgi:hypothetical protein